jgi:FixJ family two-component response regulator
VSAPPDEATVAVVDDEPAVRKGIARLLAASGYRTECFASALAFLDRADALEPGCVIADVAMPDMTGLELQRALIARKAAYPLIFVTGHGDLRSGVGAMRDGAVDFLAKPFEPAELLAAVRRAIDRDRDRRTVVRGLEQIEALRASLTPREREVFERVVVGMLNKQIAGQLRITEKTVKAHRARVMRKMRVRSVAELARMAEKLGTKAV